MLRNPTVSVDGPRPPELAFVPREEQFDGGEQDPEVFEAEVDNVEVLDDEVIPVLGSGRQNAEEVKPGRETERHFAVLGENSATQRKEIIALRNKTLVQRFFLFCLRPSPRGPIS